MTDQTPIQQLATAFDDRGDVIWMCNGSTVVTQLWIRGLDEAIALFAESVYGGRLYPKKHKTANGVRAQTFDWRVSGARSEAVAGDMLVAGLRAKHDLLSLYHAARVQLVSSRGKAGRGSTLTNGEFNMRVEVQREITRMRSVLRREAHSEAVLRIPPPTPPPTHPLESHE